MSDEKTEAEALVEHLVERRKVDAAVVVADPGRLLYLVTEMLSEGWTFEGVEYVQGKRVRYLVPPPGWTLS